MDKAKNKDAVEKYLYVCFELGGILYVPDYEVEAWVGPGSDAIYTRDELLKRGAKPKREVLWKRLKHSPIEIGGRK